MNNWIFFLGAFIVLSCSNTKTLNTVENVDLTKYQGLWYEIARLPNTFEKGLICVTAEYTLLDNGKIKVVNSGHLEQNPEKTKQSKGTAYVPDPTEPGKLKVSFFWPFAGDYQLLKLDKDYQYALVGSPSLKYLWILSRSKVLPKQKIEALKRAAEKQGFDISQLEFIDQSCN